MARAVGHPLPPALSAAYRAHDGALRESVAIFSALRTPQHCTWARNMWWLSAHSAVRCQRFMQGLAGGWPELLLPIGEDGGGNLLVVDLEDGAVAAWDHEDGSLSELTPDLHAWMTQLADDMQAGLVCADEDEESETLTLLAAPRPPAPPPPKLARERPAQVLLALLLEHHFIALAENANVALLIKQLTKALTTRAVALRCQRVTALLTESAAIAELFARDDQLTTLIEDLG